MARTKPLLINGSKIGIIGVQRGAGAAACCSPPLCAAWEDKPGFGVIQNINMSQAAAWDNIAMVNWSNGTDISLRFAVPFQCPLKIFYKQSSRLQLQLLELITNVLRIC